MRRILKIIMMSAFSIYIMEIYSFAYERDRLVDIPVPPDSSGYADFTSEEGKQKAKEYEQNNKDTVENYMEESNDNYLKSLRIEGYNLEPQFDKQQDEYTIYMKNRSEITSINIIAEANDEKARIEENGILQIKPEQDVVSINVIAENGNLKVYTIRIIEKSENTQEKKKMKIVMFTLIVILGAGVGISRIILV